jgi:hypothetical protein
VQPGGGALTSEVPPINYVVVTFSSKEAALQAHAPPHHGRQFAVVPGTKIMARGDSLKNFSWLRNIMRRTSTKCQDIKM